MKALSLAKPLLIMIIGLPGAGKTYFARHFADTFSAPLVCADKLTNNIFNKSDITPAQHKIIKTVVESQITELAKTKTTFLVDGICATRIERQQISRIATEKGYTTLLVWVQTDELTAKTRAMHRNNKRSGDEYNSSVSADQFVRLSKRFSVPAHTEDYVVISGKHPYSTQAKMVLRKLAAPRAEQAEQAHQKESESSRHTNITRPTPRRNVIIR